MSNKLWWVNADEEIIKEKSNEVSALIKEAKDFNEKVLLGVFKPSQQFYNEKMQSYNNKIDELTEEIKKAQSLVIGRMWNDLYETMGYKKHSREERNERMRLDREREESLQKELEELNHNYEILKKKYAKLKPNSVERRNCYKEVRGLMYAIDSKKKEIGMIGDWQYEDTFGKFKSLV